MAVKNATLRDVQVRKEFWEGLGAKFGLACNGALDVSYSRSLTFDESAKGELAAFVDESRRQLHALVIVDGDPESLRRFESVQWERDHGHYTEDIEPS